MCCTATIKCHTGHQWHIYLFLLVRACFCRVALLATVEAFQFYQLCCLLFFISFDILGTTQLRS